MEPTIIVAIITAGGSLTSTIITALKNRDLNHENKNLHAEKNNLSQENKNLNDQKQKLEKNQYQTIALIRTGSHIKILSGTSVMGFLN